MQAVCQTPHKLQSFYAYLIDTDTSAARNLSRVTQHTQRAVDTLKAFTSIRRHSQAFKAFNIHSFVVIRQFSQMVKLLAQWTDGERESVQWGRWHRGRAEAGGGGRGGGCSLQEGFKFKFITNAT